jgi:hypothetical protein
MFTCSCCEVATKWQALNLEARIRIKKTEGKPEETGKREIKRKTNRSRKTARFKYSMSTYSAMLQIAVSRFFDKQYI